MTGDEDMSPDASPGSVRRKSGVRRVNNLPVYLVGGAMGIFLLVMALGLGPLGPAEPPGRPTGSQGRQHQHVRQRDRGQRKRRFRRACKGRGPANARDTPARHHHRGAPR